MFLKRNQQRFHSGTAKHKQHNKQKHRGMILIPHTWAMLNPGTSYMSFHRETIRIKWNLANDTAR